MSKAALPLPYYVESVLMELRNRVGKAPGTPWGWSWTLGPATCSVQFSCRLHANKGYGLMYTERTSPVGMREYEAVLTSASEFNGEVIQDCPYMDVPGNLIDIARSAAEEAFGVAEARLQWGRAILAGKARIWPGF